MRIKEKPLKFRNESIKEETLSINWFCNYVNRSINYYPEKSEPIRRFFNTVNAYDNHVSI